MITILLAPGTVFLVLSIAMVGYLSFDFWISTTINIIPIVIFVITCFFAKNDKKVFQRLNLLKLLLAAYKFYLFIFIFIK